MSRGGRAARPILVLALCGLLEPLMGPGAFAQLRPLDPFDWSVFEPGRRGAVRIGAAAYSGQRAALAGTEGSLVELGTVRITWRLDRVAFDVGWTAWRRFRDRDSFAPPTGGAEPTTRGVRADVGDLRLATIVRLWSDRRAAATLRFGTRLPTTDNGVGLERDQTDFFALAGGEAVRGPLLLSIETGLGINGTRSDTEEQLDVMLYTLRARYRRQRWSASLALVGQESWHRRSIRGNEDLHEARLGMRYGERRWVSVVLIRGLTAFSPHAGIAVSAGAAF
ncbi:MAG TPA: hypothetical protein VF188_02125 [Longimicrobiales bacterium]